MRDAIAVEYLKLRRSPVTWVTALLVVVLCPALCLAFVSVVEGSGDGLLAAKVQAMVTGTGWHAYTGLLDQFAATALFVGFGVVIIWCFGREFSDRTAGSLFGLPVSRATIATAKMLVVAAWGIAVSVVMVLVATTAGTVFGLGIPDGPAVTELAKLLGVSGLTAVITLPLALPASIGRGYLPGIGTMVLLLISAQVAVLFGTGAWYPFAAPGLWAVSGQQEVVPVTAFQLTLVPLTALAGWMVVARWWNSFELT
jgi:ABC-2 type transport system permease protein